jgi:AcrR family transcriptional regulator
MKPTILTAAKLILIRHGLADWTIEEVAREAGCAKGLVNYHYKSKALLLAQVGESLRNDRLTRRLNALRGEGAAALDSLWNVLLAEARTGELAAWLALSALGDPVIAQALRSPGDQVRELERAASQAFGIPETNLGPLLESVLTGFQIALLHHHDEPGVREAYHRFWLGLL